MGIKLTFEITSPLDADDRELLTGVAMMTLAIANHEMAKQNFPDAFPEEQQAMPCAAEDSAGRYCINDVGHRGRHKYRQILPPSPGVN